MKMDIEESLRAHPKLLIELKFLLQSACSFSYEFDDNPNVITKEQSLVVRDIDKLVENDQEVKKRILDALDVMFSFEVYVKKALLPSVLKKEGVTFNIEQESLIRLLLRVNNLQHAVLDFIKNELFRVCSDSEDSGYLRLLLNPIKYLPNIKEVRIFCIDILDCLQLTTIPMQLEILDSLPDIIPESCYDYVAKKLVKHLASDDCPTDAVFGCFSAFDFSDQVKTSIFNSLMDKTLRKQPDRLPASMNMLFEIQKGKIPTELMLKLRNMIHYIITGTSDLQLIQSIVKVIQSFSNEEHICQSWIDLVVRIEVCVGFLPFDLFIMLILGDDIKYKELIKKNIETGCFLPDLLDKFVLDVNYLKALISSDQSWRPLIKLANYLLKYHSGPIETFTSCLLECIFTASIEKDKFLIDAKEIVDCLLKACNNTDMLCVNQTLHIFLGLIEAHPKRLYEHLHKLMGLLKKIDDFNLFAAKMAYTILCHIPYQVERQHPYSEVMRNEINMVVRKQMMSSKRMRKSIGIMGAVAQIQSSVSIPNPNQSEDIPRQIQLIEIMEPPPPSIQEAVTIFESVIVLTEGIPECIGLFYDELARMALARQLKIDFTLWMVRKARSMLDKYVADPLESTKEINGLKFAPRYASVEAQTVKSMNIGLMTVEPDKYEGSPIMLLAPLFRLFRALISGKDNKSTMITELFKSFISCSFILPEVEDIEDLNCDQIKQVADILFHTINYLKEVISAISNSLTETDDSFIIFCKKLLKERLELLVKLEYTFNACLTEISEHSFPQAYFHDCIKTKQVHERKKKPVKKKSTRSKVLLDDSVASTSSVSIAREVQTPASTSQTVQNELKEAESNSKYCNSHNIHLREIDLFSMLKIMGCFNVENVEIKLEYSCLVVVLRGLVTGLKVLLLGDKDLGQIYDRAKPKERFKVINKELKPVIKSFCTLVESFDRLDSSQLFSGAYCDHSMCYTHFLEIFEIILDAPIDTSSFIRKFHGALNPEFGELTKRKKSKRMLVEVLIPYLEYCIVLSQGVLIFQMADILLGRESSKHRARLLLKLGDDIVFKHWTKPTFLPYSDKRFIADTKFILANYFQELKVSYLHHLLTKVALEYPNLKTKNDYLPSLSIINYTNFHVLFITLAVALRVNLEKEFTFMIKLSIQIEKRNTKESIREVRTLKLDQLKLWKDTTSMMFHMMEMARNVKNRQNTLLSTFLKKSIPILKIFIDPGIPFLDEMFPSKMEIVVDILKSMQSSTRFIHQLCCQSKKFKNLGVVSHIPGFRLVLEQLIYKVKALMVAHNCEEAFLLGNLKNKDIHGNTQTSELMEEDSQENEQVDDEEMLPSEDEADVTMEDDKSESLTF